MKLGFTYNHRNASSEWQDRELDEWITDIFEAPSISIGKGCTNDIRAHVEGELRNAGWALDVPLDQNSKLEITALQGDIAFQLQTGNMSRAPYDMLKLQYLFQSGKIEAAALAVPTTFAARKMGSNIAHADRIVKELELFDRVITVPILLIAFE